MLLTGRDPHRDAASELDARRVGHKTRLVVDDLIAGIQDRPQAGVDRLGGAHRDGQLAYGVVADPIMVLEVLGDQPAQLQDAAVGGVVGLPVVEAVDRRAGDGLRRREVRLADGETDDVLHLRQHVKEAADARWRDAADALR